MFKLAALAAATVAVVDAACPNACSGHGQCGQYDACTCHVDWFGGDCSQRTCPHSWAWVTTNANGDINANGNRDDLTVYDTDHDFKSSGFPYLVTQANPNGAWEQWPSFGNVASKDEGHFYMECANRGVCDRATGECICFDGYTGAGCRRSECPSDCNGHGVCQTVSQRSGAFSYNLWDKDMSRSCVCDHGYSGADCSERKCPSGDDPLTATDFNEIQWVDIYTDRDAANDNSFSGSFRLAYTDYTGKKWTTDAIALEPYSSTASDMASNVAAALNGLPNDILKGVTVTQGYVEKVVPGNLKITSNVLGGGSNGPTSYDLTTGLLLRCPETPADADKVVYTGTGTQMLDHTGAAVLTFTDADDTTCYEVAHLWSVRFEIQFPNQPGDLVPLEVDLTEATVPTSGTIASSVSSLRAIAAHGTNGISADYIAAGSSTTTDTGLTFSIVSATKTLTVSNTAALFPNARVKVTCINIPRGTFTVDSVTDGTHFVVKEDIADCAPTASDTLVVVLDSNVIKTNADLTAVLAAGDVLSIGTFDGVTPKVSSVQYDSATGVGYIFLSEAYSTATASMTDQLVSQVGDGTSEKEECSARGLCDRTSGLCKCFKGYTGSACSIQNALSLGYSEFY